MSVRDLMLWPDRRREMGRFGEDPFRSFHREVDRLFEDFFGVPEATEKGGGRRLGLVPDVDVAETETGFEVKADLPGVEEKDLQVTVTNGLLTLKGEKRTESEEKDKSYYRAERAYGAFQRSIPLPNDVDQEKIKARFKNGVLTVSLPRSPEAKAAARKIEVKAA